MSLHTSDQNVDWDNIERCAFTLKNISSMLLLILHSQERHSDEYAAIEGVAQLADFHEKELNRLIKH
ncbi:hypothetical protein QWY97_06460 [Vibrio cortegadensis]|uniref:hypothetical protein n=1 Tax=Vibrio cortegadensis TaxID=1328770 RepID=UPI0021C47E9F|nr:hypothetical protein [Vibrio cortegadensis]MDN3696995.1 hypothetical protein [Vibrio cortegadensis]